MGHDLVYVLGDGSNYKNLAVRNDAGVYAFLKLRVKYPHIASTYEVEADTKVTPHTNYGVDANTNPYLSNTGDVFFPMDTPTGKSDPLLGTTVNDGSTQLGVRGNGYTAAQATTRDGLYKNSLTSTGHGA